MLRRIRLQNFFSFQDTTIECHPGANILIGINGSGKSNLLKALELLGYLDSEQSMRQLVTNRWGGFQEMYYKGDVAPDKKNVIAIAYEFDDFDYSITFERVARDIDYLFKESFSHKKSINPHEFWLNNDTGKYIYRSGSIKPDGLENDSVETDIGWVELRSKFYSGHNFLSGGPETQLFDSLYIYRSPNFSIDSDLRNLGSILSTTSLYASYKNFAHLLYEFDCSPDSSVIDKINQLLSLVNGNFKHLKITKLPSATIGLALKEEGFENEIPIAHISDGTLKFLLLALITENPERGKVLGVDEPELHLHPDMLNLIANQFKKASESTQFFISTHSPAFLDGFEPENVMVFEKDEQNASIVKKLDGEEYKAWLEDYTLGDMWERGFIGGNT